MKFYKRDPDRALSGMAELTLKQRGAYNSILDLLYSRDGEVPDDDRRIARMISCHWREWASVKTDLIELGKIWVEDGMICAKRVQETIKEAADFSQDQSKRAAKGWQKRRKYNKNNEQPMPVGNALTPIDTDKEAETNVSGAAAPEPSLSQIIYGPGLRLMIAGGVAEKGARSMLGKWRGEHGDEKLLAALGKAQREGALDPVGFIQGCLRAAPKRKGKADDRFKRIIAGAAGRPEGAEDVAGREAEDPAQLRLATGTLRG